MKKKTILLLRRLSCYQIPFVKAECLHSTCRPRQLEIFLKGSTFHFTLQNWQVDSHAFKELYSLEIDWACLLVPLIFQMLPESFELNEFYALMPKICTQMCSNKGLLMLIFNNILVATQKHFSFLFWHDSSTYKLRLLSTNLYGLLKKHLRKLRKMHRKHWNIR